MVFTSEQVSCGHPDKICDQISDAIVTDCLRNDRNSRCGIECLIKDRDILISGERPPSTIQTWSGWPLMCSIVWAFETPANTGSPTGSVSKAQTSPKA